MRVLLAAAFAMGASAADWAFIAAGSHGWNNMRHQAEAARAYQLLLQRGIPASNIVTMLTDDVAYDDKNPLPGKLFAKPTPVGVAGNDVYKDLVLDYANDTVLPGNWINILSGNKSAMANIGSGRVIESTAEDNVFVYFADHGAPGLMCFNDMAPGAVDGATLHVSTLIDTLKGMHARKTYKQLVFYLETCYSASMFQDVLPEDIDVYAVAASNATNPAWSWYCGNATGDDAKLTGDDCVDGVCIDNCLGDLFSISWIEDLEVHPKTRTFGEQFAAMKPRSDAYCPVPKEIFGHKITFDPSHMQRFGSVKAFDSQQISAYVGDKPADMMLAAPAPAAQNYSGGVSTQDVDLHIYNLQYVRAKDEITRAKRLQALEAEVARRNYGAQVYSELVTLSYPGDVAKQTAALEVRGTAPLQPACEMAVNRAMQKCALFEALSAHALQFHRIVVNLCADAELGWASAPERAAATAQNACERVGSGLVLIV